MKRERLFLLFFLFSAVSIPLFFPVDKAGAYRLEFPENVPSAPRLKYPVSELAVLSGEEYLEFQWWSDFGWVHHYEFRLFKGYDMYAKNQIIKEKVPAGELSIKIKAELFEDDQVYTWSLIKVGTDGLKSDKSWHSFKVIKK